MLSAAQITREAAATGFRAEAFEKAARLLDVLAALRSHPFLKSRIALKGGTALNLFVLDVPRLSVDIDLNVVGAVERETMLSERLLHFGALGAVCSRLGLQVRRAPGGHAGGKWRLAYSSSFGRRDWRRVSLADVTADPVDREGDTKYRRRSRRQRSSSASASASAGGSAVTGERSLPFLHEQGAPEVDELSPGPVRLRAFATLPLQGALDGLGHERAHPLRTPFQPRRRQAPRRDERPPFAQSCSTSASVRDSRLLSSLRAMPARADGSSCSASRQSSSVVIGPHLAGDRVTQRPLYSGAPTRRPRGVC